MGWAARFLTAVSFLAAGVIFAPDALLGGDSGAAASSSWCSADGQGGGVLPLVAGAAVVNPALQAQIWALWARSGLGRVCLVALGLA